MEGYDRTTYGDRFADVYDDWYADLTDTDACVAALAGLAGGGAVLELGVGTGRLAVPLAAQRPVTGVDTSPAMLAQLAAKPGAERVEALLGDMVDPPVGDRRFALVVIAYNTLFNLTEPGAQQQCLRAVAARLHDDGRLVVEGFVPRDDQPPDTVVPRSVSADRVVLSVTASRPDDQELLGQFIDISEQGIRLRPWHIRYSRPDQLDDMAIGAGLTLVDRWADWHGEGFDSHSTSHISIYRPSERPPDRVR